MEKEKQRYFARRITSANRTELVVITYDIIIEEIREAKAGYDNGDMELFRHEIKRAQRFLGEVMSALDYKYEISLRLLSLYEYAQRVLVKCDMKGCTDELESVMKVIEGLKTAYAELASKDESQAVMANAQTVVAGLTYGRNSLNETDIDPKSYNRGFLA